MYNVQYVYATYKVVSEHCVHDAPAGYIYKGKWTSLLSAFSVGQVSYMKYIYIHTYIYIYMI